MNIGTCIRRALARDHDVVLTTSGHAAVERIRSDAEAFDLVFCDLMMPEMTGMDLHAELLRTHPDLAAGIVFITGGAFTKETRQFLDRTANPCMEKPFDLSSIRAMMRDHSPR